MRDDSARTEAYQKAISQAAPGRVCLDLGTGALALLAVMAAQAGARHVYAIEANQEAAGQAQATVDELGLSEQITVLHGYSTDVQLPERAELLIHEIIGEVAGCEGVVAAVLDAKSRHLLPCGNAPCSVPARALTLCAPSEWPAAEYFASLPHPMLAAPGARALKLPGLPRSTLLASPQPFEDLDFANAEPAASSSSELEFAASRAGVLRGQPLAPPPPEGGALGRTA